MSIKDELEFKLKLLPVPEPHTVRARFEITPEVEHYMCTDNYLETAKKAELANKIAHFITDDPSFYMAKRKGGDRWSPTVYTMDCVVMSRKMYENLCFEIKNTVFSCIFDELFAHFKANFDQKLRKISSKFVSIISKLEREECENA